MRDLKEAKSKDLKNFYYQITHLYQKKNIELYLKNIVGQVEQSMRFYGVSKEGLCKVYTYQVGKQLTEENIVYQKVNTRDLGSLYEHECLLIYEHVDTVSNYYLVDPTFEQFENTEYSYLNPKLSSFLEEKRKASESEIDFMKSLLHNGFALITEKDWEFYLRLFGIEPIKLESFALFGHVPKNK